MAQTDLQNQLVALLSQMQGQNGNGHGQLNNAVNQTFLPQLAGMFHLQNGPRGKRLRNMDEISQVRRRQFQIETNGGDRINVQEEVVWFGEDA